MSQRSIVVLGGSAGSVQALIPLVQQLPADLSASLFVTVHLSPISREWLSGQLRRVTRLNVESPTAESSIHPCTVYVARPDQHLIVKHGRVMVSRGPRENMWRPAIDVLFRTAAVAYGNSVIAVLMSGELDDGTAGLQAVKECGGVAIVQDPGDSPHSAMARSALTNVEVDYSVPLDGLAPLITRLLAEPAGAAVPIPEDLRRYALMAEPLQGTASLHRASPSQLSCPECGGPLWQHGADRMQFRCLVGHGFHIDALDRGSDDELDRTLWAAIRLFEQRVHLSRMMSEEERVRGRTRNALLHEARADEAERHARTLRELHSQRRLMLEGRLVLEERPQKRESG